MEKLKKLVSINKVDFDNTEFELEEIFISLAQKRIVAQYKIYGSEGDFLLGVPTQYTFTGSEYEELIKACDTKTKLFGKLSSLMEKK